MPTHERNNVDNTEKHTAAVLSICTGYGGLELGLELLGIHVRPVCYVEREAFCAANLVSKIEAGEMAAAPVFTDAKSFPYERFFGRVDLLTAGYPCQPFSAAGARRGADDPRHLWPHIARGIRLCRPGWVFLENVEGHITLGLSTVISDLEEMGYRSTWGIFSAAEVGAPHQRKRVFILAHGIGTGLQGHAGNEQGTGWQGTRLRRPIAESCLPLQWPARPGEAQQEWEEPRTVADTGSKKQHRVTQSEEWNSHSKDGQSGERELADTTHKLRQRGGASSQKKRGQPFQITPITTSVRSEKTVRLDLPGCQGKLNPNWVEQLMGQPDREKLNKSGKSLEQWPTPRTQCTRPGNVRAQEETLLGLQLKDKGNLEERVAITNQVKQAKLNPNWVEQLMGLPVGWTQLPTEWTDDGIASRVDPIANRLDRLRMIGNGVCPQTAAKAFATLHAELTQ